MELETAIRTRRTHKAFGPDPVPDSVIDDLLELSTWAPAHHVRDPWRFYVIGPDALNRLKDVVGAEGAKKLDRAPTMIAVTTKMTGNEAEDEEDLLATGCAVYAILLGAHARGLAGYWRTPGFLHGEAGKAALAIPQDEHFVGLIHLGNLRQEARAPERGAIQSLVTKLD